MLQNDGQTAVSLLGLSCLSVNEENKQTDSSKHLDSRENSAISELRYFHSIVISLSIKIHERWTIKPHTTRKGRRGGEGQNEKGKDEENIRGTIS